MGVDEKPQDWTGLAEVIGQEVRRIRRAKNMTQRSAAAAAGINFHTWNRLESGAAKNPRLETYAAVASALDVEFVDLFATTRSGISTDRDDLVRLVDSLDVDRQRALMDALTALAGGVLPISGQDPG